MSEEDRITEARTLMDGRQYRTALKILVKVRESNPDLRELTQAYFDECFLHVAQVTALEKEILAALDRFDEDAAFVKMEELKKLDEPELRKFFDVIYQRRLLAKNRNEFIGLMDAAAALVREEKWREAIDTYKQALVIYQQEFYAEKTLGNIIPDNVRSLRIELDTLVVQYFSRAEAALKSLAAFRESAGEGRVTEGLSRAGTLNRDMLSLLSIRRKIIGVADRIAAQNEAVKKTAGNDIGHYYLVFSGQVILGRPERAEREGLYRVVERHWEKMVDEAAALCRARTDQYFSLAQERERAGNADQAVVHYGHAGSYAEWGQYFLGQFLATPAAGNGRGLDERDRAAVRARVPLYHYFVQRRLDGRLLTYLASSRRLFDNVTQRPAGNDAALRNTQEEVRGIIGSLSANIALLEKRRTFLGALSDRGFAVSEAARSIPDLLARLQDTLVAFQTLDTGFTARFVERDWLEIRNALADRERRFVRAKGLREGTNADNPGDKDKKYPTRALEELRALQADVRPVENVLLPDFFNRWSTNRQYLEKDDRIKNFINSAREAETAVKNLRERVLGEIDLAAEQKRLAASLFQEARDDFAAAAAAFKARQFSETLSLLDRARTRATGSLANEEDPNVRRFLENDIVKLANDTNAAGVEQRYKDALARFESAVDSYSLTNFDDAILDLRQSDQALAELPQDDKVVSLRASIENWRAMIDKARTLQPKRVLTVKDPDYPVWRKRLNLAQEEYESGLAAKRQGRADEAAARFQSVKEQVSKINEQYPYLQETGVLFLKVLKAEGEDLYRREISKRISESESLFTRDPRRGLAQLEDILEIDPVYPGLREKINRYKDQLYGPPRVEPSRIAEANSLYREALRLYQTSRYSNMVFALNQAKAANQLNPFNKDVVKLIVLINLELSKSQ